MTETQWRFLQAITEQVAPARVVELRLFPSIRQGGVESGVAVVAAEEPVAAPHGSDSELAKTEGADGSAPETGAEQIRVVERLEVGIDSEIEIEREARGAPPEREVTLLVSAEHHHSIAGRGDSLQAADTVPADHDLSRADSTRAAYADLALDDSPDARGERTVVRAAAPDGLDPLPQADGDSVPQPSSNGPSSPPDFHPADATGDDPTMDALLDIAMADVAVIGAPRHRRYRVLAAHYRLTLKGPDRGRWQFDLTHEADAPLETLERVARGVAHRAGDDGEPELYAADAIGSILSQPWWSATTEPTGVNRGE